VFVPQPAVLEMVPQMLFCRCVKRRDIKWNKTAHTHSKRPTKCPKCKCNTVSVSFSACRCSLVVFSSKVGRAKNKSLETGLWMAIWACGLPARCCQPAVAGGVIYAYLRSEIKTVLVHRLCLLRVLCANSWYKLSPFQAQWGRWHCTHFLRPMCFIYSSRGKCVFHPLLRNFPPTAAFTSFPAPGCWVCAPAPAGASLARPGLFIYSSGKDSTPRLFIAQDSPPSLPHVFIVLIAYYSVLFFPRVGVDLSRGYADLAQGCLYKYCIPLSSPCSCLPKLSGRGWLAAWGPSSFLPLTWSGDSLCRLEVWRGQSFASSQWPCLPGVSAAFLQNFIVGGIIVNIFRIWTTSLWFHLKNFVRAGGVTQVVESLCSKPEALSSSLSTCDMNLSLLVAGSKLVLASSQSPYTSRTPRESDRGCGVSGPPRPGLLSIGVKAIPFIYIIWSLCVKG
jgi:hypothetical protein